MDELFILTRIPDSCRNVSMDEKPPYLDAPLRQSTPARRPISAKKLAANRRNALLSTGPRTARGKARAAMNSLKHGILSRKLVIPEIEGEGAAREFHAMMADLTADLNPMGALEHLMVQQIGVAAWRLRRVLKYENRVAFLNSHRWKAPPSTLGALSDTMLGEEWQRHSYDGDEILADTGLNDLSLPEPEQVTTISRYENSLMRHLFRAMEKLERLQSRRRVAAAEGDTHALPPQSYRSHRTRQIP
jgi:hypothetical protein